jgi:[ribosomal protein S18]-alanine N-acetyltransferase
MRRGEGEGKPPGFPLRPFPRSGAEDQHLSATANRVAFRRLELRDLKAIERIERDSYPTPWSRSMFAGELAKPSSLSLGAFDPETKELFGYLIISRYVDAWHVMNLAVAPEHRRRRIATTLLERLFELTSGEGRRGYTLEVRVSNDVAIRLYEQAGFKPRGIRRGYYTDNREDALIMWRDPLPRSEAASD